MITQIQLKFLLKLVEYNSSIFDDLHIVRFFSSFVFISNGKVIKVTQPYMAYCPLAGYLYRDLARLKNPARIREAIVKVVEYKISKFGHFSGKRQLSSNEIAVPYGASEILMYAARSGNIDAAVMICDGKRLF